MELDFFLLSIQVFLLPFILLFSFWKFNIPWTTWYSSFQMFHFFVYFLTLPGIYLGVKYTIRLKLKIFLPNSKFEGTDLIILHFPPSDLKPPFIFWARPLRAGISAISFHPSVCESQQWYIFCYSNFKHHSNMLRHQTSQASSFLPCQNFP